MNENRLTNKIAFDKYVESNPGQNLNLSLIHFEIESIDFYEWPHFHFR